MTVPQRLSAMALLLAILLAAPVCAQSLWPAAGLPVAQHTITARPAAAPLAVQTAAVASPGQQCRRAIRAAEQAAGIPSQLMAAIARVESGRREADGSVNPWPWSINAEGTDHFYDSKAEAIAAVRALQAQGMRSIDVGCMQVNLLYHPDAFATLEDAFDPARNAEYAARFLVQLHTQTGAWPAATAWYHSATPELGSDYQRKVASVWPDEQRRAPGAGWPGLSPLPVQPPRAASTLLPVTARGTGPGAGPTPGQASGRSLAAYRAAPIPIAPRIGPAPGSLNVN